MNGPTRVLIVTWPGGGNVPPALALGRWLTSAGHEVCVAGPDPLAAAVGAAGLKFRPCPSVEPWPAGLAFEDDLARFDALRNSAALAHDLVTAVEAEAPDALVIDCMMGAGQAAAEHSGLPTAALVHVVYQPFCELWGPLYAQTAEARTALGLPPSDGPEPVSAFSRADLRLALVPSGFDGPCAPTTPTPTYVGPIFDPTGPARAEEDPHTDPLVLVSYGTTKQHQDDVLPPVLDALADLPVRVLLTLGGVPLSPDIELPSNVDVHEYLPHRDVMPRVNAVVCHGGLSTVMAALAEGVPLVCQPQGRDQGINAQLVQSCGAGLALGEDATSAELAKAVSEVLGDPRYREAAASMQARIGPDAGGPAAVRTLEELARAR